MFQTLGHLSGVVCPLDAVGDCSRPYCHFKHFSNRQSSISSSSVSGSRSKDGSSALQPSSSCGDSESSHETCKPSESLIRSHIPAIRVPQYQPTPLAVLQRRQKLQHEQVVASCSARVAASAAAAAAATNATTVTEESIGVRDESAHVVVASSVRPLCLTAKNGINSSELKSCIASSSGASSAESIKNLNVPNAVVSGDHGNNVYRERSQAGVNISTCSSDSFPDKEGKLTANQNASDGTHHNLDSDVIIVENLAGGCKPRFIANDHLANQVIDLTSHGEVDQERPRSETASFYSGGSLLNHHLGVASMLGEKNPSNELSGLTSKSNTLFSEAEKKRRSSSSLDQRHREDRDNLSSHRHNQSVSNGQTNDLEFVSSKVSSKTDDPVKSTGDYEGAITANETPLNVVLQKPAHGAQDQVVKDKHKECHSGKSRRSSRDSDRNKKRSKEDRNSKRSKDQTRHKNKVKISESSKKEKSSKDICANKIRQPVKEGVAPAFDTLLPGDRNEAAYDCGNKDYKSEIFGGRSSASTISSGTNFQEDSSHDSKRNISPGSVPSSFASNAGDLEEKNENGEMNHVECIDLSDEDPEEECRRLFRECETQISASNKLKGFSNGINLAQETQREPSKVIDMVGTTRKRIAHETAAARVLPAKKINRITPAQQLALRFEAFQKSRDLTSLPGGAIQPHATHIERRRISTVSSGLVQAVAMRKGLGVFGSKSAVSSSATSTTSNTISASNVSSQAQTGSTTLVQRVANKIPAPHATNHVQAKGVSRIAHLPRAPVLGDDVTAPPRPRIPYDPQAKVSISVRQMYLEKLIEQNNAICLTYEQSYEKSLAEERDACSRSKDKRVYLSLVANLLMRLKKQSGELGASSAAGGVQVISHAEVLCGAKAKKLSFSIEKNRFRKNSGVNAITEDVFYSHLREKYLMAPSELDAMGFPRPPACPFPGRAQFRNEKALVAPADFRLGNERICCRCKKTFFVDKAGFYLRQEDCIYHWGKNWLRRAKGGRMREQQYTCCDAESGSDGCCVAKGHVFENPALCEDDGYMTTLEADPSSAALFKKVYAVDCEMVYTTRGTELARVSMVDMNMRTVYETKVKPQNPILDYNTRFSGLKLEDLEHVTTELHEVQAAMLALISSDTILLGHSLESDLKALKLTHSCVVDTSMVFPHKMGLPYKRALKNLLKDYCQKIIQDGVDGHDSAEDAKACMELMLFKVKQDLKSE